MLKYSQLGWDQVSLKGTKYFIPISCLIEIYTLYIGACEGCGAEHVESRDGGDWDESVGMVVASDGDQEGLGWTKVQR